MPFSGYHLGGIWLGPLWRGGGLSPEGNAQTPLIPGHLFITVSKETQKCQSALRALGLDTLS